MQPLATPEHFHAATYEPSTNHAEKKETLPIKQPKRINTLPVRNRRQRFINVGTTKPCRTMHVQVTPKSEEDQFS
jgi:hypothetical protein